MYLRVSHSWTIPWREAKNWSTTSDCGLTWGKQSQSAVVLWRSLALRLGLIDVFYWEKSWLVEAHRLILSLAGMIVHYVSVLLGKPMSSPGSQIVESRMLRSQCLSAANFGGHLGQRRDWCGLD